jgi:ribulose 1,5-bisphosphate carboxylase large subunit-like protein
MRQALDATLGGISLEEYAKDHSELKTAIEQWGLP